MIYLIGSLRNPQVTIVAQQLRAAGFEVFDDWKAASEIADDSWRDYEKARGHNLAEALNGFAATHVFEFDKFHLQRADAVVLAMPAGKSGFLELGWSLGQGKPGYILLDQEPERFDVMFKFADGVFTKVEDLIAVLRKPNGRRPHALRTRCDLCVRNGQLQRAGRRARKLLPQGVQSRRARRSQANH